MPGDHASTARMLLCVDRAGSCKQPRWAPDCKSQCLSRRVLAARQCANLVLLRRTLWQLRMLGPAGATHARTACDGAAREGGNPPERHLTVMNTTVWCSAGVFASRLTNAAGMPV